MPLSFTESTRAWDAGNSVVTFPASDGGKPVRCAIGVAALQEHFGLTGIDEMSALRAFDRCRSVIEAGAARKYDRWKLAATGEVSLRARDFS